MKRIYQLFTILCPLLGFGQYEFNNVGADIYIQKGAVIAVHGTFINGNGSSNGLVKNDGVIELKGDFENKTNASFTVHNDNTSKDRAVKFTGSGTQKIKGSLNGTGTASFYNLVIDKTSATDTLQMETNVTVDGSLVFGSANTTNTYNPTSVYTNNAQKGIVKTYDNTAESVLTISNGNTDAIAGYPALTLDNMATTGFILTKGTRGNANGGVQRNVTGTGTYVFPIGTTDNGFNGVALNFTQIPAGGGLVKGKFSDGTDNPRGTVGELTPYCANCESSTADNAGYNRHFANNSCNGGAAQWLTLENSILDHGFWTFAADANDNQFKYVVETYPNSYTAQGQTTDSWRTAKYSGSFGNNASTLASDWTNEIESVENITDLLEYTLNTGSCYTGTGIPGGEYTGFGQFSMLMGNSGNALPVKMIYVKAEPNNNTSIDVKWATAIEINNSGFEVHRSTDGMNFKKIGWVNGNNNSTTTETYIYNDKDVVAGITYYYQLRQVDFDGASEMSQVVSASLNGTPGAVTTMTISEPMPNPAVDYSRIIVKTVEAQQIAVKIYDMTGRVVSENTQDLTMGTNDITLDVTQLASGAYTTVIIAGGKSIAKNLIVAKN